MLYHSHTERCPWGCGVALKYHYSQFHFDSEWQELLGSYLWVKYIYSKIICFWLDRVKKPKKKNNPQTNTTNKWNLGKKITLDGLTYRKNQSVNQWHKGIVGNIYTNFNYVELFPGNVYQIILMEAQWCEKVREPNSCDSSKEEMVLEEIDRAGIDLIEDWINKESILYVIFLSYTIISQEDSCPQKRA